MSVYLGDIVDNVLIVKQVSFPAAVLHTRSSRHLCIVVVPLPATCPITLFSPCNHLAPSCQQGPAQSCQFLWWSGGQGQASPHTLPIKGESNSHDKASMPASDSKFNVPCFAHTCCQVQRHKGGEDQCYSSCWLSSSWLICSPDPIWSNHTHKRNAANRSKSCSFYRKKLVLVSPYLQSRFPFQTCSQWLGPGGLSRIWTINTKPKCVAFAVHLLLVAQSWVPVKESLQSWSPLTHARAAFGWATLGMVWTVSLPLFAQPWTPPGSPTSTGCGWRRACSSRTPRSPWTPQWSAPVPQSLSSTSCNEHQLDPHPFPFHHQRADCRQSEKFKFCVKSNWGWMLKTSISSRLSNISILALTKSGLSSRGGDRIPKSCGIRVKNLLLASKNLLSVPDSVLIMSCASVRIL